MTEQEVALHDCQTPCDLSEAPDGASGAASYSVMPKVRVEPCACGYFIGSIDLEPFIRIAVEHHNRLAIHEFWRVLRGIA